MRKMRTAIHCPKCKIPLSESSDETDNVTVLTCTCGYKDSVEYPKSKKKINT